MRGIRRDHYAHVVSSGADGLRIGARRFHGAVHAAEQIDLIRGLKDVLVDPEVLRVVPPELQDFFRDGIAAIYGLRRQVGGRIARGVDLGNGLAGRREVRIRRGKVAIGLQRLLYETIETRVAVQAPPRIWRRRCRLQCGVPRHEGRAGAGRQLRRVIVRADRACGNRQHGHGELSLRRAGRHEGFAPPAPRKGKSGGGDAGPSGAALRNTTISNATTASTRDRDETVYHRLRRRRGSDGGAQ